MAIISGLPDMSTHRARVQGFEQVMRERFPKICIVEKINSRDQSVIAYEKHDICCDNIRICAVSLTQ